MKSIELEQEYPTLTPEAVRYNMQVLAIRRIVETLQQLDRSINEGCGAQRSLFDSSHKLFEGIHKDLTGLLAGNADIRQVLIATQDAIEKLSANLPDRESIAPIRAKNACNDIYSTFEDQIYLLIERINVDLTPEVGRAVMTLRKTILNLCRESDEPAIPETGWHEFRDRLGAGFDICQRWSRALWPLVSVIGIPLLVFLQFRR